MAGFMNRNQYNCCDNKSSHADKSSTYDFNSLCRRKVSHKFEKDTSEIIRDMAAPMSKPATMPIKRPPIILITFFMIRHI